MSNLLLKSLALAMVLGQFGCQAFASIAPGSSAIEMALSKKERSSSSAPQDDLAQLVAGDNAFALDLFRALKQDAGNVFYSPYSISSALAMTYAGARGVTAQQMAQVLHFTLPGNRLHPAVNSLDLELARRGEGAKGKDGEGFRLNVVNAVWGQKGYQFAPAFLDILAGNYGAGLRLLDFRASAEDARLTINGWVSRETENRIQDLLAKGDVDDQTRLVLTNAIYFNAAWAEPFSERRTHDGPFSLVDGSKVTVPMMSQTSHFLYGQGDGYQVVELPYDKRELSMLILLPATDKLSDLVSLDVKRLGQITKGMASKRVVLTLPKFKVEATLRLADLLRGMGMRDAFDFGAADFSGMDGTRNLYIHQVIHKAFVSVDEAGTEAAAATAVVVLAAAMMPTEQSVTMTVDHPFLFLIRDNATGAILFVGRVTNPA